MLPLHQPNCVHSLPWVGGPTPLPGQGPSSLLLSRPLCQAAQAAIAKYFRLHGLTNKFTSSHFWRLGSPRSRSSRVWSPVTALALACRGPFIVAPSPTIAILVVRASTFKCWGTQFSPKQPLTEGWFRKIPLFGEYNGTVGCWWGVQRWDSGNEKHLQQKQCGSSTRI